MDLFAILFLVLFGGAFVSLVAGMIHWGYLSRLLRKKYPEVWEELGRPRAFSSNISSGIAVWKAALKPPPSVVDKPELRAALRTFIRIQVVGLTFVAIGGTLTVGEFLNAILQRAS